MLGRAPSKKTVEAIKIALGVTSDKWGDKETAAQIWKDFRWRLKTIDGDYKAVQALLDEFTVKAEAQLKSAEIRSAVLEKFSQMRVRLDEFAVDLDAED